MLYKRGNTAAKIPFGEVWFYDTGSGKLFTSKNVPPPVAAPSGSDGVRAMIFSCDECVEGKWTFAYIETHTPEAKAVLAKGPDSTEPMEAKNRAHTIGRLVALPPEGASGAKPNWVPSNSPQAAAIVARGQLKCPDSKQYPQSCSP